MTYGRERRGVIQKRFGESFLDGKEGSRGKNAEQGLAAVIVFVPRERVDFFDALSPALQNTEGRTFIFPLPTGNGTAGNGFPHLRPGGSEWRKHRGPE